MRNPNGPATNKQIKFARDLGLAVPPGITIEDLARMIDAAPPTAEQRRICRDLGIEVPANITAVELNRRIKVATIQVGQHVLRTNRYLRVGACIGHNGDPHIITAVWPETGRVTLQPAAGGKKFLITASKLRNATAMDRPRS